jgi:hypothetical protein
MEIRLDPEQVELLREVLDGAYRDLRYEVADTDRADYKRNLRAREEQLRAILDLVGGPLPDRP